MKSKQKKVFLVCTGLGHINRGYETFTRECFDELKKDQSIDLLLLKGGGESSASEHRISNLPRNHSFTKRLAKLTGKETYWLEQFSFFIGMLPSLIRHKPALIYYSDFLLGTWLWHLRKLLGFKYKLLFSNGAPNGPPFTRTDHIQQLLPMYMKEAAIAGTPADKQTLLPYAINISLDDNYALLQKKIQLRQKHGVPINKKVIISIGAINKTHKRIDYLIEEFSKLSAENYFLIALGQKDAETDSVMEIASGKLITGTYLITQVAKQEVAEFLSLSDFFVLTSLHEGQPRVTLEALSMGFAPIVHDYNVSRETLGKYGVYTDMTQTNVLEAAIAEAATLQLDKKAIMEFSQKSYSWEKLAVEYVQIIHKTIG